MAQIEHARRGTFAGVENQGSGNIAYGAAQMARFVLDHAKDQAGSFWFVEMDMDRRFRSAAPRFLRAHPSVINNGRVGNGVMMCAHNAARRMQGSGCYSVVHFCGGDSHKVNYRDRVTAERLVKGVCGCYLTGLYDVFFVDFIQIWRDGTFISFREHGVVEMDGGKNI